MGIKYRRLLSLCMLFLMIIYCDKEIKATRCKKLEERQKLSRHEDLP